MSVEEYLEKGYKYFKKSKYHNAIKEYEKVIESNPESSAAWYFLGKTYGR
ncbi:MAG: tetratricopeptide repeat protein, partial [Promethearchaeota archaeon]